MFFQYTADLPYLDPTDNGKFGYRLPRSILLPPYLRTNPYFVDYMGAIDFVFDELEQGMEAVKQIRNMWSLFPAAEQKVAAGEMLVLEDWGGPDRATVIQQANLLGMKLSNAGLVDERGYRAITKHVGQYWFEKGKSTSVNFLGYCLGTQFKVTPLWTKDYVTFVSEDLVDGARIYDNPPGPWYPTTHIELLVPGEYNGDPETVATFFYEVSNYNLVVNLLLNFYDAAVTSQDSEVQANIVQMGLSVDSKHLCVSPYYPLGPNLSVSSDTVVLT